VDDKNLKVGDLVYITHYDSLLTRKEIIMVLEIDTYETSNNVIISDYVLFDCEKKEKFWIPSSPDRKFSLIKIKAGKESF
tara:strand:- start:203 stop:442 length:240 start_codon:yes stop_codon:yes gene_type:complete